MSAERVADTIDATIQNPFPDIITVGNGKEDTAEYENFFDETKLAKEYIDRPLFIHLDMSVSGDKTGIAGIWIIGKKPTAGGDAGNDLFFQTAFSTSIEAPKGRQISFEKNRNFIRWLRDKGFLIKEITSDTFQSYDLQQQLSAEGFNCSILSVDRVESVPGEHVGICRPYQYLKNTIYEGRIKMYKSELLHNELIQLEKNNNTGKIDHPIKGSKDQADAVCGATFTASKYAEEYAFRYGENLQDIVELNDKLDGEYELDKAFTKAFEQELLNSRLAPRVGKPKDESSDDTNIDWMDMIL